MADVREGLEQAPQGIDFDAALAQQVEAGRGNERSNSEVNASADEIRAAVATPDATQSLRDQITVAPDPLDLSEERELARLREEQQPLLDRARKEAEQEKADLAELAERREQDRVDRAFEVLEDSLDPFERAEAFDSLNFEQQRVALEHGLVDEDEPSRLARMSSAIRAVENAAQTKESATKFLRENAAKTSKLVSEWQVANRLTDAQANARLEAAERAAQATQGVSIERLSYADPEAALNLLVSVDSGLREAARSSAERQLQNDILNGEGRSISDGLERFTDRGWRRVNQVDLPPPKPDMQRLERALERGSGKRRETADSIRAGIMDEAASEPSREIREVYEVGTNAKERSRAERERELRNVLQ